MLSSELTSIHFPTWPQLTRSLLANGPLANSTKQWVDRCFIELTSLNEQPHLISYLNKFQQLRAVFRSHSSSIHPDFLAKVRAQQDAVFFASNEFYTIFDFITGDHVYVHDNCKVALGIESKDFRMASLLGLNPKCPLYHPEDVLHMVRSSYIAYQMLAAPFLSWKPESDSVRFRFRVQDMRNNVILGTSSFVLLEKNLLFLSPDVSDGSYLPPMNLKRWKVLDSSEFRGIQTTFYGCDEQTILKNSLHFLLNAFLIDFPAKHLLIMDAKTRYSRNKEVASEINDLLSRKLAQFEHFNEQKIGDLLAKSIRPTIRKTFLHFAPHSQLPPIIDDLESIECLIKLGLLPLAPSVKEMLLSQCFTLPKVKRSTSDKA